MEGAINQKDECGRTLLIRAVLQNNIEAVQFLLKEGASPHIRDDTGLTALEYAHTKMFVEVATIIADHIAGKSINAF